MRRDFEMEDLGHVMGILSAYRRKYHCGGEVSAQEQVGTRTTKMWEWEDVLNWGNGVLVKSGIDRVGAT